MEAHLSAHPRLHWRDMDLIIHLLLLITESAPEPKDSAHFPVSVPLLLSLAFIVDTACVFPFERAVMIIQYIGNRRRLQ